MTLNYAILTPSFRVSHWAEESYDSRDLWRPITHPVSESCNNDLWEGNVRGLD